MPIAWKCREVITPDIALIQWGIGAVTVLATDWIWHWRDTEECRMAGSLLRSGVLGKPQDGVVKIEVIGEISCEGE